jgi:hypothetical protein
MKSLSRPFKSSGTIQHSPISINNNRYSIKNKQKGNSNNSLNLIGGGDQTMASTNSNNTTKHNGINVYTHHRPFCCGLTNV